MSRYVFYYDESEHSRVINQSTITADNYYDNFITVIVGWEAGLEDEIKEEHHSFELKYSERMSAGELKSSAIKNNQLNNGFASLNKHNISFLYDFLKLFSDRISLYFCTMSKIEYIIWQLFNKYGEIPFVNTYALKYSIVKAIHIYKPEKVIDSIYNHPESIISSLKEFFEHRIIVNQLNPKLKEKENHVFSQVLFLLNSVAPIRSLQWKYNIPFEGFQKYLHEKKIQDYSLIIDREGNKENTVCAAIQTGLKNVADGDSKEYFGIRMADMMAGLIAKMMKALCTALIPANVNIIQKTILPASWFELNNDQLNLYKQFYHIIVELDHCWYKSYAGNYADDLVTFIALLDYVNHFSSIEEMKENSAMHGEYFNSFVCNRLAERYRLM